MNNQKQFTTQVLIIGGGVTGTGLARDLALRGVHSILVEKKDIDAGASGGNHGLLHSGGRYVSKDREAARECREEGDILKKVAPHCIEETGGLFVAVKGDDENYAADFPAMCEAASVPVEAVDLSDAKEMEPELSDDLTAAFKVPDASVDPFKLALDNMAHARELGSLCLRHTRVKAFDIENKRIQKVHLQNELTGEKSVVEAEQVINAAGAWAGKVAGLAGIEIPMIYSKGTLLITQSRISRRVINRLRLASDADILVPGGTVSILGTTSVRIDDPDDSRPTIEEVDRIVEEGAQMVPALETCRYIRAYAGVRPLVSMGGGSGDRAVSRGFTLADHSENDVDNFTTITGGKLTTYRLMAERTADMVCEKMGISAPCTTRTELLPPSTGGRWTEPGLSPRQWIRKREPSDLILCECEMVSQKIVDELAEYIRDQKEKPTLNAIGLRSRIGKGPCQGGFCSVRIAAHLYDREYLNSDQGLDDLREFLNERWRGKRPVLWDVPLMQAELQEALHCGLFGMEL